MSLRLGTFSHWLWNQTSNTPSFAAVLAKAWAGLPICPRHADNSRTSLTASTVPRASRTRTRPGPSPLRAVNLVPEPMVVVVAADHKKADTASHLVTACSLLYAGVVIGQSPFGPLRKPVVTTRPTTTPMTMFVPDAEVVTGVCRSPCWCKVLSMAYSMWCARVSVLSFDDLLNLLVGIDIMSAPQAASSWAGTSILEIARMEQAYCGVGFTIDISTLASAALPRRRRTEQSLRPTLYHSSTNAAVLSRKAPGYLGKVPQITAKLEVCLPSADGPWECSDFALNDGNGYFVEMEDYKQYLKIGKPPLEEDHAHIGKSREEWPSHGLNGNAAQTSIHK
ncbi:hypothetical protein K438DRAFT_1781821 [Mycena galopus ATCC 62051]|nr:hypothetical protein K438DRAFT_1781821 [Mycena galopus ATCC 62051]